MKEHKSRFISTHTVLGCQGQSFSYNYGTVTFLDNGCFDLYGSVTLNIESVINSKTDGALVPYEFKAFGDDGKNGENSKNGEDAENGMDGIVTQVDITIGTLEDSITVASIGGSGGKGGDGLDGLNGGAGGDAAKVIGANQPKGGAGGDASDGSGKGGSGGVGGTGPTIIIRCETAAPGAQIKECRLCSTGGAPGLGGKGGLGGAGGINGDGITFAPSGNNGTSCRDGEAGAAGEPGRITVQYGKERGEI